MKLCIRVYRDNQLVDSPKFDLKPDEVRTVGREGTLLVLDECPQVSRSHGDFWFDDQGLHYKDHSSNGTFFNGSHVQEHLCKTNDRLVFGKYTVEFVEIEGSAAPVQTPVLPSVRHRYKISIGEVGFFGALGLFTRTLPFSLARFCVECAVTAVSFAWFLLSLGVFVAAGKIFPLAGLIAFVFMMGVFGAAWRGFFRYFYYLLNSAHVVVLTDLIVYGKVQNGGESMLAYGKRTVRSRVGEVSGLFVMHELVKGVLREFHRTVVWIGSFIPGSQNIASYLNTILKWASNYIDEAVFSYGIARNEANPWKSSREGLIYYCQNSKAFLMKAFFMTLGDFVLTGAGTLVCFLPLVAVASLVPQGHLGLVKLIAFIGAMMMARSVKSCFVRPVMMIMILTKFHAVIQGQPINPEWDNRLSQLSEQFRKIKDEAVRWTGGGKQPTSDDTAPLKAA